MIRMRLAATIVVILLLSSLPIASAASHDSGIWDHDSGCDGRDRLRLRISILESTTIGRVSFCDEGAIPQNLTIILSEGTSILLSLESNVSEQDFSIPETIENPNLLLASAIVSGESDSIHEPEDPLPEVGSSARRILPSLPVGQMVDCERVGLFGQSNADVAGLIGMAASGPVALAALHPCSSLDLRYENVDWLDASLTSLYDPSECTLMDLEYRLYQANGSGPAPVYDQLIEKSRISSFNGPVGCPIIGVPTLNTFHHAQNNQSSWNQLPRNSPRGEWLSLEVTAVLKKKTPGGPIWMEHRSDSRQFLFQNGPYHMLIRSPNGDVTSTSRYHTSWYGHLQPHTISGGWENVWLQDQPNEPLNDTQRLSMTGDRFYDANHPGNRVVIRTEDHSFTNSTNTNWLWRGSAGWNSHSFEVIWEIKATFLTPITPPFSPGQCRFQNNSFHYEADFSVWFHTPWTGTSTQFGIWNKTSSTNQSDSKPNVITTHHNASPSLSHIPMEWNLTNAVFRTNAECRPDHGIIGENGGWVWGLMHFQPPPPPPPPPTPPPSPPIDYKDVIDTYANQGGLEVF